MSYILLFDIGNTNIKIGVADAGGVRHSFALPTATEHSSDSLGLTILQVLSHVGRAHSPTAVLASSVVPRVNPLLREGCRRYLEQDVIFVPEDKAVPLIVNYSNPEEIGADRLVGAYAARRTYPEAETLICVDYGTATTVDLVHGDTYLGGLICPGVQSSARALAIGTAKLPSVSLEVTALSPMPITSTSMSMNHGFVFGFAAMTEGLVRRIAADFSNPPFVLATGGFAPAIARVTDCFDAVRSDLLLDGLRMLYIESL